MRVVAVAHEPVAEIFTNGHLAEKPSDGDFHRPSATPLHLAISSSFRPHRHAIGVTARTIWEPGGISVRLPVEPRQADSIAALTTPAIAHERIGAASASLGTVVSREPVL